jgi:hypothetical protein
MNERIREIAVKSGMTQMNRRSDGFYVVSEKTFELFATELIRESAAQLDDGAEDGMWARGVLYRHFGVEE